MKNPFMNLLTAEEQKVIFFVLVFAFIGITVKYTGLAAGNETGVIDSLTVMEDVEIKFDLNTVSAEELISIPGIGSKRAADIISFRDENGFVSRNDLLKIKGIGETSLNKIKDYFYAMEGDSVLFKSALRSEEIQQKIDLNNASIEDLCKLKGIGPSRAEKIIEMRNDLGGFSSLDELLKVKGIGEKTLEKLKPDIFLGE